MSDGGGSHESLWWSDLKIVCEGGRNINWFDEACFWSKYDLYMI